MTLPVPVPPSPSAMAIRRLRAQATAWGVSPTALLELMLDALQGARPMGRVAELLGTATDPTEASPTGLAHR